MLTIEPPEKCPVCGNPLCTKCGGHVEHGFTYNVDDHGGWKKFWLCRCPRLSVRVQEGYE